MNTIQEKVNTMAKINKKTNLEDIANTAGVSKATVSNALNNKNGVSEETKKIILKLAKDMGYHRPNKRKNLKQTIRIILYKRHGYVFADTPFFSNLIEGIQKECQLENFEMMITHVTRGEEDYKKIIENIKNDDTSGYLILATEMFEEDLQEFKGLDKPVIILDSYFKHEDFDFVVINNFDGSYKAANYLIQKGHVNIGYLHSSVYINNFHYRKIGFLDALKANQIEIKPEYQFDLEPTLEGSYKDMKKLLKKNPDLPTAFFADNDIIAFGAMKALQEKGIRLPEDVSLIGFDDMPYCQISTPKMTTVKVFKQYFGSLAIKRLIEKIHKDEPANQKIEVNTHLVERESVIMKK